MSSPLSGRPLPSSFDENEEFYNESGFQKVLRRMKREPLVPLGCLLTVAAFTNAYRAMRRGDHHQVQRMFRARVLAQGFTLVCIVTGGLYFGAERQQEREGWKRRQQEEADEKRHKWIRELEVRDEEEKELRARLDRRRERKRAADAADAEAGERRGAARDSFRAAEAKRAEGEEFAAAAAAVDEKQEGAGGGGSGWALPGWLGGSKSSAESEPERPPPKSQVEAETPKK